MRNIYNLFKFIENLEPKYVTPARIKFAYDNNNITADDLTVHGNLDLRNTSITSLPDNLTVNGYLDLTNTQIASLPDNLTVHDWVHFTNTPLSKKYTLDQLKKLLPGVAGQIAI